jgi:hypothetical protein
VQSAHAAGVLHRDLKPKNVVFREPGEPVVVDWGLGGVHVEGVRTLALGTQVWAPPEQLDGVTSESTDVFGLAAILLWMLTEELPQQAAGGIERLLQDCGIPDAGLAAALERGLAGPRRRFASVAELLQAVQVPAAIPVDPPATHGPAESPPDPAEPITPAPTRGGRLWRPVTGRADTVLRLIEMSGLGFAGAYYWCTPWVAFTLGGAVLLSVFAGYLLVMAGGRLLGLHRRRPFLARRATLAVHLSTLLLIVGLLWTMHWYGMALQLSWWYSLPMLVLLVVAQVLGRRRRGATPEEADAA